MSWFLRPRKRPPETLAPFAVAASHSLIGNQLSMTVATRTYDTVGGPIESAAFATRGFVGLGERELVLVVRLRPAEDWSDLAARVGRLFSSLFEVGRARPGLSVGARTILAPQSSPLLGRPDFLGIVYTHLSDDLRGLVDAEGLLCILVTGREVEIAERAGQTRLLGQLGKRARFFPTPPWSDRDRPELLTNAAWSGACLPMLPTMSLYGASAWITIPISPKPVPVGEDYLSENLNSVRIEWWIEPRSRSVLETALRQIADTQPIAILLSVAPGVPRCLTWMPGQEGMSAISDFRHGSTDPRCAGNFLALVPDRPDNQAIVIEDGFGAFLRAEDWQRIRAALTTGEEVHVRDSKGEVILILHAS
jgi:hypothetical protein